MAGIPDDMPPTASEVLENVFGRIVAPAPGLGLRREPDGRLRVYKGPNFDIPARTTDLPKRDDLPDHSPLKGLRVASEGISGQPDMTIDEDGYFIQIDIDTGAER